MFRMDCVQSWTLIYRQRHAAGRCFRGLVSTRNRSQTAADRRGRREYVAGGDRSEDELEQSGLPLRTSASQRFAPSICRTAAHDQTAPASSTTSSSLEKNCPRSKIEVRPTALPPLTLTYDLDFQSQASYR